jgi:hypothetical protein
MTTEKLTLEICFKYPNAKIINKDKDIIVYSGIYYWIWASVLGTMNISDCKLILRPLSSLTDGERIICYQIDTDNVTKYHLLNERNKNGIVPEGEKRIRIHYEDYKKADYLRSISVDIDSLQERGIAVYE